jgi:hypothetical protein
MHSVEVDMCRSILWSVRKIAIGDPKLVFQKGATGQHGAGKCQILDANTR